MMGTIHCQNNLFISCYRSTIIHFSFIYLSCVIFMEPACNIPNKTLQMQHILLLPTKISLNYLLSLRLLTVLLTSSSSSLMGKNLQCGEGAEKLTQFNFDQFSE